MPESPTSLEWIDPPPPESLLPDSCIPQSWIVAAALLAFAFLAAVMIFWKKQRKIRFDPQKRRKDAYQEARSALAALNATDVREAAVQCSLILRRYLSLACGDPSLFETHEEFIARHEALSALGENARTKATQGFERLVALKYTQTTPGETTPGITREAEALLETLHHGFTK